MHTWYSDGMKTDFVPDPVLPDVLQIKPPRYPDSRGWFTEVYNERAFRTAGLPAHFVQDNQSFSVRRGTVRGMHFQRPPYAQAKLVRCLRGRIMDVAVDLRYGSASFGKFTAIELTAESGLQVFIPEGFAHGFCTLEDDCQVFYKVSDYYAPGSDWGVAFDDPDIGIVWPFPAESLTLSVKDRALPGLRDLPRIFDNSPDLLP